MKRIWIILLIVAISLIGCSNGGEKAETNQAEASREETVSIEDIEEEDVVAEIDGHELTGKDVIYEMKRLELIALLQGTPKESAAISPTAAIQELMQNHALQDIASESEITVNKEEQKERAEAVRADVETVDGYEAVMEGIDENLFWSKEENRYESILAAEALVAKLMEEEKEVHPNYTEEALRFDAQKELNELIQQKIGETDVEIYVESE